VCFGADMELMRNSWKNLAVLRRIVDESHFIVNLRRCGGCGQRFVSVFCESTNWANGDDLHDDLLVPVSEAEAEALVAAEHGVEAAVRRLSPRRHLVSRWPRPAGEPDVRYVTGTIYTAPHD
jgi:hypothetical protein